MVKGAQIAQWLEKLRRQNQRQEAGGKRDARPVMAEIKFAEVGETEINRDQRNGQRREELQYPGG